MKLANKKLLFILLCCSLKVYSFKKDTLFVSGANATSVVKHLSYFKDCDRNKSGLEILNVYKNNRFVKNRVNKVINKGFTSCNYWFELTVKNNTAKPYTYFWSFYNDGIQFTLYEIDELNRLKKLGSVSNKTPLEERKIPVRCLSFPINFGAYESKQLFLKTEVVGHANLYFPTDFTTDKDVLYYEIKSALNRGAAYGFFLFAMMFNLLLFLVIRKRIYLYMFAYVTSLLAFNIVEYMYEVLIFSNKTFAFLTMYPKMYFILLSLFFYTKVFQHFTRHKIHFKKLNLILNYSNGILLAFCIVYFVLKLFLIKEFDFFHKLKFITNIFIIFHFIFLMCNIVYAAIHKNILARYYLLCNSLLIFSVIIYITNTFNLTSLPGFIHWGTATEIITLSIAFVIKYKMDFKQINNDLKKEQEKRELLTSNIIKAQENERRGISENLHDGLGNTINALKLALINSGDIQKEKVATIFNLANQQFRDLIYQIAPKELDEIGLYASISQLMELFNESDINFNLTLIGNDTTVNAEFKINSYRIFQELINNVIKHSEATEVDILMDIDENNFTLQIEDNGVGFKNGKKSGFGIKNIKSRIAYLNGTYHAENLTKGMITIVEIPI